MTPTTGILLFPEVEELDFAGPWEVFTSVRHLVPDARVVTVARTLEPVRCAKGLQVLPDCAFDTAPALDVLVVPGGAGARKSVDDLVLLEWLRKTGAACRWLTSVCTGTYLLHAAGFTRGKRVTTHWAYVDALRERGD